MLELEKEEEGIHEKVLPTMGFQRLIKGWVHTYGSGLAHIVEFVWLKDICVGKKE